MTNDSTRRGSESSGGVNAVETTFTVVETLRELNGGTVSEIVQRTDLSKGAVYKHLTTLMRHGFVVKRGTEYRLGFRFLDYGGWLRSQYVGSGIIKPQIQELARETGEVALFTIRENGRAITLFRENGNHGVLTRTRLGRRLFLNQTAGGKAILSQLSRAEVDEIVEEHGLPGATANTITERDELYEELATIRDRGYSLNDGESTEGLVAIAVPLVPNDTVVGACAVAGPRHRMQDERLAEEISGMLLSVVNELELNIAHSQQSVRSFDAV